VIMLANDSQYWVGLGWVNQLMGWVGSGHTKWTRGQLWSVCPLVTTLSWAKTAELIEVRFVVWNRASAKSRTSGSRELAGRRHGRAPTAWNR